MHRHARGPHAHFGRIGSGPTPRPARIARSVTAEEARQRPARHPSRRVGARSPQLPCQPARRLRRRGCPGGAIGVSLLREGRRYPATPHQRGQHPLPLQALRHHQAEHQPGLWRAGQTPHSPLKPTRRRSCPPKCPPGSQPTSADANRRPPSADTLARFPQLAGPLTYSYHGQTPQKGSPVRYRKTAMTCEPPYGIEP